MSTNYWPKIENTQVATEQMRHGSYTAGITAVLTASLGIAAIVLDHPVLGITGWALVDAAVFAVVAWRVYCLSLLWAFAGFVLFVGERVFSFMNNQGSIASLVVGVLFGLMYLHAVRGGLHLSEVRKKVHVPSPLA